MPDEARDATAPFPGRLRSLDVFRGLTVALMIVVNNPGSWSRGWAFLRHAPWNGWTLADLVFPWFLLSVGVSIALAFGRELRRGQSRTALARRALRRALVLLLIGLALHLLAQRELTTLRIPGVLQRIAVCFAVAALLFLVLGRRGIALTTAALLLGYWAILVLVPVPGGAAGELTPEGSIVGWVDRALLGTHLWAETKLFDPEGILSTLGALASTLLGVLAGIAIDGERDAGRSSRSLALAGALALGAGLAWGVVLPINKSIWTSSYALFSGGAGLVLLALISWLVEARGLTSGLAPMEAFGVNALAMFVFSGVASRLLVMISVLDGDGRLRDAKSFLYRSWIAPLASPAMASFAWSILVLGFWLAVAWALRERRILLKI